MDIQTFAQLLTPLGQSALHEAAARNPTDETLLADLTALRKRFPEALARAALETVRLRQRARRKFTLAERMYFTREALEQSTSEVIARYRADRYAEFPEVADLCCGIGGDAIALANQSRIVAIDVDPVRLAMAWENFRVYGVADRAEILERDLMTGNPPEASALFCDPSRRVEGHRSVSMSAYRPTMERIRSWALTTPLGVKVAPGVPIEELTDRDAEAEFISLEGELKECVLWFGPLRRAVRRATLLPGGDTLATVGPIDKPDVAPVKTYLLDPDPAVIRSGLLGEVARQCEATLLDAEIAYLSTDQVPSSPFARAYRIEATLPFHLRRLREALRERQVGRVTALKRGSPIRPEELMRQLKLSGDEHRVVVLTRVQGRPVALIGESL